MRQMTMKMPIARIVRDELNVAGLRHAHEHGVRRLDGRRTYASALRSRHRELMAMQMNWMVIHTEIDEPDADALSEFHQQRGRRGA